MPADFPETVLQFGTGVLLKGLPDYLLQLARNQGRFAGSVVSVRRGTGVPVDPPDTHYTVFENGVRDGRDFQNRVPVSVISRELDASLEWEEVLNVAVSPALQVILSNSTEAGLQYQAESILAQPPATFPAKLTAVLWARFQAGGSGLVVIPCELLPENGRLVLELVLRHLRDNGLPESFADWVKTECRFCDSLVDRIVSGHPAAERKAGLVSAWGEDPGVVVEAEPYWLWAIQTDADTRKRLGWGDLFPNWIVADDISLYRERKLRLLNGTHTIMVGLALWKGAETVLEAMQDPELSQFTEEVALREIAPATPIPAEPAESFAREVLDRFRNPHIRHELINITLQFTLKMAMRNLPTLDRYEKRFGHPPAGMARGFAAFLHFMNPVEKRNGTWWGRHPLGREYPINDDKADVFAELRASETWPRNVWKEERLWSGFRFSPGFQSEVERLYVDLAGAGKA